MPISPARINAFDTLLRVETQDAYASELLHSEQTSKLLPQDRNLATQIVMGTLRWQSRLDAELQPYLSGKNDVEKLDAEVRTALRMAVFQSRFLDRVPASAIVNDAVALVKKAGKTSASALVNAVLRKVKPQHFGESSPVSAKEIAQAYAHPFWLVERWAATFGSEQTRAISAAGQQQPEMCLRFPHNTHEDEALEKELSEDGVQLSPGRLVRAARRVASGDVTATRAFREKRVGIQDEASQLVALLVGAGGGTGERILDCCAAPGGKTQVIAQRNPGADIVAMELHPQRARMMRELLAAQNVEVVTADVTSSGLKGAFGRVLADVPCSGTGTLARNPEIKWRLKPGDLADLHQRQVKILNAGIDRAAPNARIVYSTCSLEKEEDEDVVADVLRDRKDVRIIPIREIMSELSDELAWKDLDPLVSGEFLRTLPGVHPCDGFFATVLQKA